MHSHQISDVAPDNSPQKTELESLRRMWRGWAAASRRHHLDGILGLILEAGRPFALVSAQLLYLGQPLLGGRTALMARLLESDTELTSFIEDLAGESRMHRAASRGAD